MFKEIFSHLDVGRLGEAGMLLFLATFVAVTIYAFTRRRSEMEEWANLPLANNSSASKVDEEARLS